MSLLPDVQGRADGRGIALAQVGVRGVAATLTVADSAERHGPLVASLSLWTALEAVRRGGHLSRFGEFLAGLGGALSTATLGSALADLAARLDSPAVVGLRVEFPLLWPRAAPQSGVGGEVRFPCALEAQRTIGGSGGSDGKGDGDGRPALALWQEVEVAVQTLCPCSKEISERGAHNQRCRVRARVASAGGVAYRELVALGEGLGSAPLYPVLKRVDEKGLTERAYDHPAFVEDVVRDLALALDRRPDILAYRVSAESEESIHPHNAYALVERGPVAASR